VGNELVLDLDEWIVTLRDGSVLRLLAHGYSQEGDEYVFSALMRGKPHYEVYLARIPVAIVATVLSG
jgi:hypothetical protein